MSSNQSQLQRVRHDIKIRRLRVEQIEDLSASLKRFTFSGDDLDSFASASFDDHLKAFFPNAAGELHLPQVGEKGVVFPEGVAKPAVREYTPTGIDLAGKRLALEFAIHDAGPATSWAQTAQVGDEIGIAGPRGSIVLPMDLQHYILVGDETALPAIRRRLGELPASANVYVIAEVNGVADETALPSAATVSATWVHRAGKAAASEAFMLPVLANLQLPQADVQVWIACEREQARQIREWFLEQGWDKHAVRYASYWNKGTAAYHEPHED